MPARAGDAPASLVACEQSDGFEVALRIEKYPQINLASEHSPRTLGWTVVWQYCRKFIHNMGTERVVVQELVCE